MKCNENVTQFFENVGYLDPFFFDSMNKNHGANNRFQKSPDYR